MRATSGQNAVHTTATRRAPIIFVLVPGIYDFHQLRLLGRWPEYFRGVERALDGLGVSLLFPTLSARSVEERARNLAGFLSRYNAGEFALIAHSMGGLDSRYLISKLDVDRRVRTLVTIGTPHHGTPVASWVLQRSSRWQRLSARIGTEAIEDLTPEAALRRNAELIDRADVAYWSYAGCRPHAEQAGLLRPFSEAAGLVEQASDGLVPVSSTRWGQFRGTVRADHFELVGWSLALPSRRSARPFDHAQLYRTIVTDLIDARAPP